MKLEEPAVLGDEGPHGTDGLVSTLAFAGALSNRAGRHDTTCGAGKQTDKHGCARSDIVKAHGKSAYDPRATAHQPRCK